MLRTAGRGLALVGLALLAGCGERGTSAPPTRLVRLFPDLGRPEFLTLADETRPAIRLLPGERRLCRALVARGSRLFVSFGIGEGAPAEGQARFTIREGERELLRELVPVGRGRWLNRSLSFDVPGEVTLELAAEHVMSADGPPLKPASDAAWLLVGSPRLYPPRPAHRPRVFVWISQDAVRADHLATYGYERATTPEFDRLSRGWTVFERAESAAPWTLPSLVSQMTSRYPSFHGAVHRTMAADPRHPTIFETLAAEGYTVFGVTGNAFVSPERTLARGFDALVYTGLRADSASKLARSLLDQWAGGDLVLFVHYMDAHDPYAPPPPYQALFGEPYDGIVDGYNHKSAAKTPEDVAHVKALYDGEIAYTDREIAGLLGQLGMRGLLDGAVIAYTADHGEELLDHGRWGHLHSLYEELLHVPFALRIPGAPAHRVAEPVSMLDLAPSVLDFLGVPAPGSYQGRSLKPLVRGGTLPEIPLFAETSHLQKLHRVSVRHGRFKSILSFDVEGGSPQPGSGELYDLETDPEEQEGVQDPAEAARLRQEILAFLESARAAQTQARPAVLRPEEEERLKALGYAY